MANFQFSTDILRRLGEELNPSIEKGILELVKNAYDADAPACRIKLEGADKPGGTLIIEDSGEGMTRKQVEEGWLVLGGSLKDPRRRTTKFRRLPAGSKGLGRLAALRLGSAVRLTTVSSEEPDHETIVEIDWAKFDSARLVESVSIPVVRRKATRAKPGTRIEVSHLRTAVSGSELQRLARELVLLTSPFASEESFKIELDGPEFEEARELLNRKFFEEADYSIEAAIDTKGRASVIMKDFLGRELFNDDHEGLREQASRSRTFSAEDLAEPYDCPPLSFKVWVFLLGTQWTARQVPKKAIREWVNRYGGVHIYQNGLRVSPYGDPGNDWLDMNRMRVSSPEERPSTNNTIGQVFIDDPRLLLVQKTDRGGFIETLSFQGARQFCQHVLNWAAFRRLDVAENRRMAQRKKTKTSRERAKEEVAKQLKSAPPSVQKKVGPAVDNLLKQLEKELQLLGQEVQLYRTMSTAGINAATFAHESEGNPLKIIHLHLNALEATVEAQGPKKFELGLKADIDAIRRAADSLNVLSGSTLRLVDPEKRRIGKVDVNKVVVEFLDTFKPFLDGRGVKPVAPQLDTSNPFLIGSEAALESVLSNLVNNALQAFDEGATKDRRIEVQTLTIEEDGVQLVQLRIDDSGPGIRMPISRIWLPGETTREQGTGLGLTIVRDTVGDLDGHHHVDKNGKLGGASFAFCFPRAGGDT